MKVIRAICFDLDNTLWDVWPVIVRAEQAMYEFLAQRYPRVVANMTIEMMRVGARADVRLRIRRCVTTSLSCASRRCASTRASSATPRAMAEEAFDAFISARNQVELYEEVLPALEQLRTRYRLFTASNGNADLDKIGLAHFFERTRRRAARRRAQAAIPRSFTK